jgi:hypothetical protein
MMDVSERRDMRWEKRSRRSLRKNGWRRHERGSQRDWGGGWQKTLTREGPMKAAFKAPLLGRKHGKYVWNQPSMGGPADRKVDEVFASGRASGGPTRRESSATNTHTQSEDRTQDIPPRRDWGKKKKPEARAKAQRERQKNNKQQARSDTLSSSSMGPRRDLRPQARVGRREGVGHAHARVGAGQAQDQGGRGTEARSFSSLSSSSSASRWRGRRLTNNKACKRAGEQCHLFLFPRACLNEKARSWRCNAG